MNVRRLSLTHQLLLTSGLLLLVCLLLALALWRWAPGWQALAALPLLLLWPWQWRQARQMQRALGQVERALSQQQRRQDHQSPEPLVLSPPRCAELARLQRALLHWSEAEHKSRQALLERLHHATENDPLTGLLNRNGFERRAEYEWLRQQRHNSGLSLLLIKLCHLSELNAQFGHVAGDRLIQQLGYALRSTLRKIDLICRLGGGEFCLLLPDTQLAQAELTAQRLHRHLAQQAPAAGDRPLSIRIGVVELEPGETISALQGRADVTLQGQDQRSNQPLQLG
ncbi:GGDEF domain-containing protein [Pseudaeromonas sp. ZJS20]|uniref:GGDEF domain-containing protein n=1 Tax=Pseudaeromonas aegiceratis TaxID=3153928 RepID=UPI00390C4BF9